MGEPSQIGQRPSSATPAHTGSVPDAAPATNSAAGRVKPGNWAAPTYSDLDKAVKNDLDELVTASDNYVFDLGFLVSAASLVVRTSDAQRMVNARNKLHEDVAKLIAAAAPGGTILTAANAETVGERIIETYAYIYNYPKSFIADAVKSALAQRTLKK